MRLQDYLLKELAPINARIDAEIARLDDLVRPVAEHVLTAGGKRLRPLLTILTARALGCAPEADVHSLAVSLEFLHSATLIHDDILDGADLRRGRPAAHTVFDVTPSVLAGDVLMALANRLVADYGDARLCGYIADAIMHTAVGEIREIGVARRAVPLQTYLDVIIGKTARMIEASCLCGAGFAKAPDHLLRAAGDYGLNLGIAFQLVDDALDYAEAPDKTGKPRGGDLREGKMTMPLILYLDSLDAAERGRLTGLLGSGELGEADVAQIMAGVGQGGFARATRDEAARYATLAGECLAGFPPGPERDMLHQALDYVVNRDR